MSESKHTPGPWHTDDYGYIWACHPEGGDQMIADHVIEDEDDYDNEKAYLARMRGIGAGLKENGQMDANAKLIAAAPCLLAAAIQARDALSFMVEAFRPAIAHYASAYDALTAAIAKATGEETA